MKHTPEYIDEDFQYSWPERVFGSETEYTVSALSGEQDVRFGMDHATLLDFVPGEYAVSHGRNKHASVVTCYGGELYSDMSMLEYATGEAESPQEVNAQERAGEAVTQATALAIRRHQLGSQSLKGIGTHVYKRSGYAHVYDRNGATLLETTSVGHHENYYSVSPLTFLPWGDPQWEGLTGTDETENHPSTRFLVSYLVLRKLFDGAGMIDLKGFSLSQKATAFNFKDFTNLTQQGQKMAFQSHDGNRLEIRTGEGNKSDWVVEQKYGLTSLILRLVEQENIPADLIIVNPEESLRSVTYDPFATVLLDNGQSHYGIDILKQMVDYAAEHAHSKGQMLPYEEKAIREFDRFYNDLHSASLPDNDIGNLGYIDWAARFQYFLEQGGEYATMTTRDLSLVRHDLMWDEVKPNDIARRYLSKLGGTALVYPQPIPSGRAKERVLLAERFQQSNNLLNVDWDAVKTTPESPYLSVYLLPNPHGGNIGSKTIHSILAYPDNTQTN